MQLVLDSRGVLATRELSREPEELLALHPDERAFADTLAPLRRTTWVGGRLTLRAALASLGIRAETAILATPRGAPLLPAGVVGSISHKAGFAIAGVAFADDWTLGIDVEEPAPKHEAIARHVLTPREQGAVATLPRERRADAVLLRFSLKEAIYKAIDPWLGRLVGFTEIEVEPLDDGRVRITPALREARPPQIEAAWRMVGGRIVSEARAWSSG